MTNTAAVRSFNLELERFLGQQIPALAVLAHKKVTLDALRGVVKKSPVDTGRFRANWQVSVGAPVEAQLNELDRQPVGSVPSSSTEAKALAAMSGLAPYGVSFLQNNLPYAEKLEFGSSSQAPMGMVAVTMAELERQIIEERDLPPR